MDLAVKLFPNQINGMVCEHLMPEHNENHVVWFIYLIQNALWINGRLRFKAVVKEMVSLLGNVSSHLPGTVVGPALKERHFSFLREGMKKLRMALDRIFGKEIRFYAAGRERIVKIHGHSSASAGGIYRGYYEYSGFIHRTL